MPLVRVVHFKLCFCKECTDVIKNQKDGDANKNYEVMDYGKGHLEIETAYVNVNTEEASTEEGGERRKTERVPKIVDPGKVKVISYTWGQWNRSFRVIGHKKMNPGDPQMSLGDLKMMSLGDEWLAKDHNASFIETLHRICNSTNDPSYCWIDQLCSKQEPGEIRNTLNMIPFLYRGFPVVAILPGARCSCMVEYSEIALERPKNMNKEASLKAQLNAQLGDDNLVRHKSCFNVLACAQYFRRVWPRQELYYAHELRAEWTSTNILPCSRIIVRGLGSKSLLRDGLSALIFGIKAFFRTWSLDRAEMALQLYQTLELSSFPHLNVCVRMEWEHRQDPTSKQRKMIAKELGLMSSCTRWDENTLTLADSPSLFGDQVNEDGVCIPCRDAERIIFNTYMVSQAFTTRIAAERAMADWCMLSDSRTAANSTQALDKFLAGKAIERKREQLNDRQKLSRFLTMLERLSSSFRDASEPRDLVMAVWVDCPLYKIPEESKKMSLAELLNDALAQLQKNWGISPVTSLPSGLFSPHSAHDPPENMSPLAWWPSQYLNSEAEYKSTSVYAPVFEWLEKQMIINISKPTKFVMEYPTPQQSRVIDLRGGKDCITKEVLDSAHAAMSVWPLAALIRLAEYTRHSDVAQCEVEYLWPANHCDYRIVSGEGEDEFLFQIKNLALLQTYMEYLNRGRGLNKAIMLAIKPALELEMVPEDQREMAFNQIFAIVCYIIGIDSEDAKRAGLHLVLDMGGDGQPARLGLSNMKTERPANTQLQDLYLVPPTETSRLQCRKVMVEVYTPHRASTERNAHPESTITGIWIQPENTGAKRYSVPDETKMGLVSLKKYLGGSFGEAI